MSDAHDRPVNYLGKQAYDIIDEDTDWVDFARKVDTERLARRDGLAEGSYSSRAFRSVLLAYLWATVEKESCSGIPKRLDNQPDLARAFGFDPDDLPSESTFRPARLNNRFGDLESTVETAAEQIRTIAAERGSPIGYDILGKTTDDSDTDDTPSNRTVQRLLRKKGRQVLDELKSVALPSMSLPRPEESVYDTEELLVLEAFAAIKRSAANKAGRKVGDDKNPNPDLDDPFYEDGPSGETVLDAVKEMSVSEIATVMNFALRKTYTRAKPRLQELEKNNGSRFGVRAQVALDMTYVAYYGDRDEMKWVQGAPDDKGYDWCHKFATVVIVGDNTHYVVGVSPLGSAEYADTNAHPGAGNSYYVGDVARRLLSIADEYVNIQRVYADREFYAADAIRALEDRDLNYVIPVIKDRHRVKPICDEFDNLKSGYDEEKDTPLYVKRGHVLHGSVKREVTNTKVSTNLVVLPPDEDDEANDEDSPQAFATNLDVSDEVALDRRWAAEQIEKYSNRGAIENSYSSIKKAAAWTTSKAFEVRWFHFAFGCVVYNMWLLVDFLTQDRIGVIETRKKPRITLSRFLDWLDKELDKLL